jgi:endonuclease YncB( thermonuclease family)
LRAVTIQSKIRRKNVPPVRVSRIRRDPVRVPTEAELKKAEETKREREMRSGITGIALFGAAIAFLVVGVGAATYAMYDPAGGAHSARFRQCYNAGAGTDCVLDGDTIRLGVQQVDIAGLDAPKIHGSSCGEERTRGIGAAVRLASLLNSGDVVVGDPFRDQYGRAVGKVEVNGKDVAKAMIAAGVAKPYIGETRKWCGPAAGRSGTDS